MYIANVFIDKVPVEYSETMSSADKSYYHEKLMDWLRSQHSDKINAAQDFPSFFIDRVESKMNEAKD